MQPCPVSRAFYPGLQLEDESHLDPSSPAPAPAQPGRLLFSAARANLRLLTTRLSTLPSSHCIERPSPACSLPCLPGLVCVSAAHQTPRVAAHHGPCSPNCPNRLSVTRRGCDGADRYFCSCSRGVALAVGSSGHSKKRKKTMGDNITYLLLSWLHSKFVGYTRNARPIDNLYRVRSSGTKD